MTQMWGDADPDEVRHTWADKLSAYEGVDIKYALDACEFIAPDFPPTLFKFLELCRIGRAKRIGATTKLAAPAPRDEIDERVARHVRTLLESMRGRKRDGRAWARRILERVKNGERLPIAAIEAAREALHMNEATQ